MCHSAAVNSHSAYVLDPESTVATWPVIH